MWGTIAFLFKVAAPVGRALSLLGDEHGLLWARLKLFDRFADPIQTGPVRITRFVPIQI